MPTRRNDKLGKVLHELKVHQVELEAQNQELLDIRADLEKSVEKYYSLFEYSPIGYITHDEKWKIFSVNSVLAKMLGLEKSDILNSRMSLFIPLEDLPLFYSFTRECHEISQPHQIDIHLQLKKKKQILVQLSTVCVSSNHYPQHLFQTAVIDITERRRMASALERSHQELEEQVSLRTQELEESVKTLKEESAKREKVEQQLIQFQKMESIGLLAGGIAHDFNNLLTIISGYGVKLQKNLPPGHPLLQECVEQVLEGAKRATKLTKNLLAFSRHQTFNLETVSIQDLIHTVTKFMQTIIGEDIQVQICLPEEKLYVNADALQIEQVLINLFTNARDAMPKGGTLSVSAQSEIIPKGEEKTLDLPKPGSYAHISVTDSGRGIDKKAQEKIFVPFYTTKEVGKGTGLGLSIAYGIIKQHGGSILFKSKKNQWTTFHIYLPLTTRIPSQGKMKKLKAVRKGTETILVVEDEQIVRTFLKETLEAAGYKIMEAKDGQEAVEQFKKQNDIALVLSDVIMPRKNGEEMLKEMREIKPGVKAIFLSGYTAGLIQNGDGEFLESNIAFISKPFLEEDLLKKVRDVLDA